MEGADMGDPVPGATTAVVAAHREHSTHAERAVRWLRMRVVAPPPVDGDKRRLVSVDVLRAVAIAGMLMVNNRSPAGEPPAWLTHVDWEGLHFADVVFPWFVFIAGVAMALSFSRRSEQRPLVRWARFAVRVAALFAVGLALNYYAYGTPLRIMGVLQRIALSLAIAAPFARREWHWPAIAAIALLAGHSATLLVFSPDVPALGETARTFGAAAYWVDASVLGTAHLYRGGFDPEGLLGVLSSAGQALLGVAVGRVLVERQRHAGALALMLAAGLAAVGTGWLVAPWLPVIKKVWTASFVLVTSGWAVVVLAVLYLVADWLRGERLVVWAAPLGRNAIAVYVGSVVLSTWLRNLPAAGTADGTTLTATTALATGFVEAFGPHAGAIAYPLAHLVVWYAVAAAMDRSGVRLRL